MAFRKRTDNRTNKIWIYGSGTLLVFLSFLASLSYLGIEVETSGDIVCKGTISNPCISYFNITLKNYSLCTGSTFGGVYFDKEASAEIYKADMRYSRTNPERWKPYNFSTGKCLEKGKKHEFMIKGYKNPKDTIKWSLDLQGKDVDPIWFGIKTIYIENNTNSWVITKYIGLESERFWIELSNKTSLTPELCFWNKTYVGRYNQLPNTYTARSRIDSPVTFNKAQKNGYVGYCGNINATTLGNYIRLGTNTIVLEYQEQKRIEYQADWFNLSATLYIALNGDWNNTINSIFVYDNPEKKKFGANVTGFNGTQRFKYAIESSSKIESSPYTNTWIISNGSEDHAIDLDDICRWKKKLDCNEDNCTILGYFQPNCSVELNGNNLSVEFFAEYNETSGVIWIDPEMYVIEPTEVSGEIIYRDSGNFTPRSRLWDGTTKGFGGETSLPALIAPLNMISLKSGRTRNETAAMAITATSNTLYFSVKNNSNNTWSDYTILTNSSAAPNIKNFDMEYMDLSDDLMIVYDNNSVDGKIWYRIWNGTLSDETAINYNFLYNYAGRIKLERRNNSNEMVLAFNWYVSRNTSAAFWNSTAWTNLQMWPREINYDKQNIQPAFESSSGRPLLFLGTATGSAIKVYTLNFTSEEWYQIGNTTGGGTEVAEVKVCSDPNSDYIGIFSKDDGQDAVVQMWDGSEFLTANNPAEDATTESNAYVSNIACAWGRNGTALFAYNSVGASPIINWFVYTRQTNNWTCPKNDMQILTLGLDTANCTVSASDDVLGLEIYPNPTSDEMVMISNDITSDIVSFYYNSTNFTSRAVLETGNGIATTYQPFDFAWTQTIKYITRKWVDNNSLDNGGIDVGIQSSPSMFYYQGKSFIVSSDDSMAFFHAYNWNGTAWVTNGTLDNGIEDTGSYGKPVVFNIKEGMHMIMGHRENRLAGYSWNGTSWVTNNTLVIGINGTTGNDTRITIFNFTDNNYNLISGNSSGFFSGYNWNGTSWVINSSIISGIENVQGYPEVFSTEEEYYLISIKTSNAPTGYKLIGQTWIPDVTLEYDFSSITWSGATSGTVGYINNGLSILFGTSVGYIRDGHSWIVETTIISDTEYPLFFNYWDNNGTLLDWGIGSFNVSVNTSNTTVGLYINYTNYTGNNITGNVFFNDTVNFTKGAIYPYFWWAYGNGTSHNYNQSGLRYYTVNSSSVPTSYQINFSLNGQTVLRFLNCSPDWEFMTYPLGQTSTVPIINATNNGSATGDFQIKIVNTAAVGWSLWASNDSGVSNLTLSTTYQTIWSGVTVGENKSVWLYGNCSFVNSSAKTSIDMQAV
jgi:hypothetical protein